MHNLIEKYRNNNLSAEEMRELRQLLDTMSDSELGMALGNDWENSMQELSQTETPDKVIDRIERSISRDIRPRHRIVSWTLKAVACCVAAAICVASGMFIHERFFTSDGSPMIISANQNEMTDISFPDGSRISMNPHSSISYETMPTESSDRHICFNGIGHFNIAKDSKHPFIISAAMLDVTVLGTEFYLAAESDAGNASLYLQEGAVELLSKKTSRRINMHPGDLAVLDYATGNITVTSDTTMISVFNMSDNIRLNYHNVSLESVVQSLNTCYAPFRVTLDSADLGKLKFTGSLPRTNLMEALSILEYTANLKLSVANSEITLYR